MGTAANESLATAFWPRFSKLVGRLQQEKARAKVILVIHEGAIVAVDVERRHTGVRPDNMTGLLAKLLKERVRAQLSVEADGQCTVDVTRRFTPTGLPDF